MKKFEDLTFTDHYMFEKVLQNKDICKELLERLLKIKIERLEYPKIVIRTTGLPKDTIEQLSKEICTDKIRTL